jgi:ABC-type polysaccharide/polyol phosphate export permease
MSEIRYVIPYITNLSLFAFPILYNENFIQDEYKTIYMTIPVVWIIAKSNDILVGNLKDIFSEQTFIVFFISFLIFSAAYLVYWKVEKYITDYL